MVNSPNSPTYSEAVPRMPLVWTAIFAGLGISVDRWLSLPIFWMVVATITTLAAGLYCSLRQSGWSPLLILVGVGCLFASWHHQRRNFYSANEIGLVATLQANPVLVRGTVLGHVSHVESRPSNLSTIPGGPEARFTLRADSIRNGDRWQATSGRCRVIVKGEPNGIGPGDQVEIVGKLRRPPRQMNPGGYSRFERARVDRVLAQLIANHPACVEVRGRSHVGNPRFWMARIRQSAVTSLFHHMGREQGELAAALLLGTREYLERSRVDAFFLTGTIHLLAISGLHVGILAWGLFMLVRLSLVPRDSSLIVVMLLSILYAALTGGRAPVMRATILVVLVCGQLLFYKRPVSLNGLAAAALFVLVWNPMQLYQVGAQLSFLAVGTLIWARPLLVPKKPTDPLDRLIRKQENYVQSALRSVTSKLRGIALVSVFVWLATLPLVMYQFHVVAPAALALNLVLWLPMSVALFLGFGVLCAAPIWPGLAGLVASGCACCLATMESLVQWACSIDGSHFWTAGPDLAVVCLFYILTILGVAIPQAKRRIKWWAPGAAVLVAASTFANTTLPESTELRCTFLSLGTGTSIVLQLPSGEVWLYDAGALGSPEKTVNQVSSFLWSQGIGQLDGLIVSHADADHYNAVPGVAERFGVRLVCLSPSMLGNLDRLPIELSQTLRDDRMQLRVVEAGSRWSTPDGVHFSVLHPQANKLHDNDNSNSLVLLVEYQGRYLLLPGDLERGGMIELMEREQLDCDVSLAPHHGSRYSMPAEFCSWCRPEWVIVCGGQIAWADEATERYQGFTDHAMHTAIDGLVEVSIREGELSVSTWKSDQVGAWKRHNAKCPAKNPHGRRAD